MSADLRMALSGAFCALAGLAACQAPAKVPRGQEPAARTPQEAFTAWADALPAGNGMPPMSVDLSMAMAGDLGDFSPQEIVVDGNPAADMAFAMSMKLAGDLAGPTRFRMRFDAQMDMAALKAQSGGRPTVMGCTLVGDGETIWLEPDWSKAWFVDELREQGIGIENMVFSIQAGTVRQLLEVLPQVMPEEQRALVQSALECSASPAALARLTARTAKVLSFSQRAGRISAELETLPGAWSLQGSGQENGLAQFMQNSALRGTVEFDQATGAILRASYAMAEKGASLNMSYRNTLASRPFPPDFFRYQLPAGRKVFPVDVFMNPIVMELRRQAGAAANPDDDDFEF